MFIDVYTTWSGILVNLKPVIKILIRVVAIWEDTATTKEINPVYKESGENEDYPGHTAADFTHGPSQPFYCHSKPEPCLFAGTLTLAPPFNALVITIAGRMSRRDNEPHHNNCGSKHVHRYFHLGMIVEL